MRFTLNVNGQARQFEADPEMPLLWALRDFLGLKGAKYGCGIAVCGACTVQVGGKAVRSCVVPVGSVGQAEVRTIEGLGGQHPVQQAWLAVQVPQCGYCQTGQIMQAVTLLEQVPRPTAGQIRDGMDDVLCRCGTYPRIEAAILLAVDLMHGRSGE